MDILISELVSYALERGLIEEADKIYVINRLLELFGIDSYTPAVGKKEPYRKFCQI